MNQYTSTFVEFCRTNFDEELSNISNDPFSHYQSLSICIIDCIYSLQSKYLSTINVVKRYAAKYMGGNMFAANDSIKDLIRNINNAGGAENFANNILKNKQKSGKVLKSEICYNLAKNLESLKINTMEDFKSFDNIELLEEKILSVKGCGDAAMNYLFMLAGDPDRCKPDIHVKQCVKDACEIELSNEDYQLLFTDTVKVLRDAYPTLTVAKLDHIIWNRYKDK